MIVRQRILFSVLETINTLFACAHAQHYLFLWVGQALIELSLQDFEWRHNSVFRADSCSRGVHGLSDINYQLDALIIIYL